MDICSVAAQEVSCHDGRTLELPITSCNTNDLFCIIKENVLKKIKGLCDGKGACELSQQSTYPNVCKQRKNGMKVTFMCNPTECRYWFTLQRLTKEVAVLKSFTNTCSGNFHNTPRKTHMVQSLTNNTRLYCQNFQWTVVNFQNVSKWLLCEN